LKTLILLNLQTSDSPETTILQAIHIYCIAGAWWHGDQDSGFRGSCFIPLDDKQSQRVFSFRQGGN
jgi:hypothetical protein